MPSASRPKFRLSSSRKFEDGLNLLDEADDDAVI